MNISIRAETPGDIDAIARLTEAAFRNETHSSHTEQYIVDALRRAGALTFSLVAEANGQVISHIAASPVTIDGEAGGWYRLAPLSVAPGRQRQGLGSQLVRRLLTELRLLPAGGCVVLGEPTYYSRFGLRVESGLALPGVPAEYFQAQSFSGRMARGIVAFHAAFDASD
ncbi:TPA: N-acetyltransferase [Pseudomonas aeruginosa]|nr:N-acetyltransferase [Pseudomonas aeruginosa]HBO9524865.1 N-acetyltransferase [Pseudomonas aeruginosa]